MVVLLSLLHIYDKFILATSVVDLIDIHVFLVGSPVDIPNPPLF